MSYFLRSLAFGSLIAFTIACGGGGGSDDSTDTSSSTDNADNSNNSSNDGTSNDSSDDATTNEVSDDIKNNSPENSGETASRFSAEAYSDREVSTSDLTGTWILLTEGKETNTTIDDGQTYSEVYEYVSRSVFTISSLGRRFKINPCLPDISDSSISEEESTIDYDGRELTIINNSRLEGVYNYNSDIELSTQIIDENIIALKISDNTTLSSGTITMDEEQYTVSCFVEDHVSGAEDDYESTNEQIIFISDQDEYIILSKEDPISEGDDIFMIEGDLGGEIGYWSDEEGMTLTFNLSTNNSTAISGNFSGSDATEQTSNSGSVELSF